LTTFSTELETSIRNGDLSILDFGEGGRLAALIDKVPPMSHIDGVVMAERPHKGDNLRGTANGPEPQGLRTGSKGTSTRQLRAVSKAVTLVAAVVIVAIIGAAFFLVSTPTGTKTSTTPTAVISTTTSSTTTSSATQPQTPPPGAIEAFIQHLNKVSSRDIPSVLADYQDNAVVVWTGNTAGLGGEYDGVSNIRLLYASALSTATTINLIPSNLRSINNSATQVTVNSTLTLSGNSNILGKFNGTVVGATVFSYTNGAWKITRENWDYKTLNVSSSGGATTFPEWQKVGEPIPSRRSPDSFHNLAWDFGGPGIAVVIFAYVATLAILVLTKHRRELRT